MTGVRNILTWPIFIFLGGGGGEGRKGLRNFLEAPHQEGSTIGMLDPYLQYPHSHRGKSVRGKILTIDSFPFFGS